MGIAVPLLFLLTLALLNDHTHGKTLRDLVSNDPDQTAFIKRLTHEVDEEYTNDIQFDSGHDIPVSGTAKDIDELNQPYRDILFEGDIRLNAKVMRAVLQGRAPRSAIRGGDSVKWTGYVPFAFDARMNAQKRRAVMAAIDFWRSETCIEFRPRTTETQYLYFVGHDKGCWSTVGKDDKQGQQWISIGNGCESFSITTHELAHALGLFHQQSRPDRDTHVLLIKNRIIPSLIHNFRKGSTYDMNTFDLPYDIGSVMHYGPTSFSNVGNKATIIAKDDNLFLTMGNKDGPTFLDVQIMNQQYSCQNKCPIELDCKNGGYTNPRNCAICKCPPTLSGTLCEYRSPGNVRSCGGVLNARQEWQTFSHYMTSHPSDKSRFCNYHIEAPEGKKIRFKLIGVGGTCNYGCPDERSEFRIHGDRRPTGYRLVFCCPYNENREFTSHSSSVPVIIKANRNTNHLEFQYKLEE